jgi:hypothetical protein
MRTGVVIDRACKNATRERAFENSVALEPDST